MSLSVHMHISEHAETLSVSLGEVRVCDHFLQSLVASWRDEHLNKMGNQATFMCLAPDFELQDLKHYFCKKLLSVSSLSIFLSFVSCGIYLYYLPDLQWLEIWDASFAQNWDKSPLILVFLVLRHLQVAGCSFSCAP